MRQYLQSETPAPPPISEAAKAALVALKTLGIEGRTEAGLRSLHNSLLSAVGLARSALDTLTAIAGQVGLTFSGTTADVHRVQAIEQFSSAAPLQAVQVHHDGLLADTAVKALRKALSELAAIRLEERRIEESMYADSLPPDNALHQAILTLREGEAWYRMLQSQWRDALRLHRRIDRSKDKKSAAVRLQELEALKRHRKALLAWLANPSLQLAAGPHFKGQETPLEELLACAEWFERSTLNFEAADMPREMFRLFFADRTTLVRLAGQITRVGAAVDALTDMDGLLRTNFGKALPSVLKDFDVANWFDRIKSAQSALGHIESACVLMRHHVQATASANVGLGALRASQRFPDQFNEFENDGLARGLLGEHFQGFATGLEPMRAAHAYGLMVKSAHLPAAVERILLSGDCTDNYRRLQACSATINQAWGDVADFAKAMDKHGAFDPVQWMDPSGKTTTAYALELTGKTRRAADHTAGLPAWAQYVAARQKVANDGLTSFAERLERGVIPANKLKAAFTYRFYATVVQHVFEKCPELRQFSGLRHSAVRRDFAALDRQIIKLRGGQIAQECRARSRPPAGRGGARVDDKTEMELIHHLVPQQKPRVPVRRLLKRAGAAIQQLKPCFMMGPQAVAQFLAPDGRLHFDIVVMDEASQLRPEEAIGAIARGNQLVVVGDPKQLPPTSFFSRMAGADGDEDGVGQLATSEAESILDVCISHFQPVRTLRWHYRSRHESLIAFSNHHFYGGNLLVFPSPYPKSKALGLKYQYIADGVYESQMNQVEATRVVDAAVEHILSRPEDSLGIVTLNIKQRDLVAELLEGRLRSLPAAIGFRADWEQQGLGLFIKNLENVQGDERDCILISTTFGRPRGAAAVRQTFGPISRDGGWRRLNVLFTRARKSVTVLSSMRPQDIVVDEKTPAGTRALRNYLEYARTGVLPIEVETGLEPESDFEVAVLDMLRQRGYEGVPQLGVAGFRIDIAVRHPSQASGYLAAIECDGAAYHTGVSVRDRDRIRQEILEGLGWRGRIWRIWSTDWFCNPLAETARLLHFLDDLKTQPLPNEFMQALEVIDCADTASPPTLQDHEGRVNVDDEQVAALVAAIAVNEAMSTNASGEQEPPDALAIDAHDVVFSDEEDDLEVDVGDLVTYAHAASPHEAISVRITARQTDPHAGLVAESTPLGSVLMGATVGETVVLRVPSKPAQPLVIQAIKRAPQEAVQ